MNDTNIGVENGHVNGGHCCMNSHTVSEWKNRHYIVSTKKRNEIYPNRSEIKYNGLQDGVGIDVMLPLSTMNQYENTKYKNEDYDLLRNGNIPTPNNSSVSTLNLPSVTLKMANDVHYLV